MVYIWFSAWGQMYRHFKHKDMVFEGCQQGKTYHRRLWNYTIIRTRATGLDNLRVKQDPLEMESIHLASNFMIEVRDVEDRSEIHAINGDEGMRRKQKWNGDGEGDEELGFTESQVLGLIW